MSKDRHEPPAPLPDHPPPEALRESAGTYGSALSAAGGAQIESLLREDGAAAVGVGLYRSPPYDLSVPPMRVARLSITLTPSRVVGAIDGDRPRSHLTRRHALFVTPAGASAHWRKDAPSRHLNLYFRASAFAAGDMDAPLPGEDGVPLLNAHVPGVAALANELALELQNRDAPLAVEAADSLARLILVRIARHQWRRRAAAHPLSPLRTARLLDYVQAHLGERILVADLARVVGLSPNRFAQAWLQQTGQSPHRFVLHARLERARTLLLRTALPIAQIAVVCGFATQQHLTQAMRQHLGVTPGRLRAEGRALGGED